MLLNRKLLQITTAILYEQLRAPFFHTQGLQIIFMAGWFFLLKLFATARLPEFLRVYHTYLCN